MLDKADVLAGLFASWDSIDALLAELSESDWATPTSLPGWTVSDVVAHLIGTESMLLGIAAPQPDVDVAALDHVRNDIGAFNENWVVHLRGESPAAMLQRFREVTGRRRSMLTKMIPEAWNALTRTPAGPDTYGRFMRIRVFDCWMHELDIRDAVGRPASDAQLGGADTAVALDEVEASMGFVVGKKGQAPDGSRVLLELTGPAGRPIRVAVDEGRASVVEDFYGTEPTATIVIDALEFTRRCGGRPIPSTYDGGIDYRGDTPVGARIVANLAYVI